MMKTLLLLVLSTIVLARDATAQDAECVAERAAMVETIRAYARSAASVLGQQGLSDRVLEAMQQTKRHLFIPNRSCSIAYADMSVPIGLGQTISQPFVVALMTQLDGGWAECVPFDAIVVTAALGQPPPPLIEQLRVGGRLVMPVGSGYTTQQLTVLEEIAPDKTTTRAVTPCVLSPSRLHLQPLPLCQSGDRPHG